MIGIVLATLQEAQPLLDRLAARHLSDRPFPTYWFPALRRRGSGVVVISGMGRQAAAQATEYLIAYRGATTIINLGVCGALAGHLSRTAVLRIEQALDGDALLAGHTPASHPCAADAWTELPAVHLASTTEPVFQPDRKARLAASAQVVDMEGYAVADACRRYGRPCYLLKGVTDLADGTGKDDILRHLPAVSEQLAETVVAGLDHLPQIGPGPVASLLRFIKIEHNLFSLPLLLAGAWLGAGSRLPAWTVLAWIAVAGVGARALGMAMNRIFDRHLDARNLRTAGRELPTGRMSLGAGLAVAAAGLSLYLISCYALGPLCLKLSPLPAVVLIGYSLLKRFTSLCHFGIGLCLALAPLCAFVAVSGNLNFTREILLLALFTFCWISGFDIIYALQDLPYDLESGVWSLPVRLGAKGAAAVAAGVHLVAAGAIIWLWLLVGGGLFPGLALAVALAALAVGHCPLVPLPLRFFPTSAVACLAGALIPILGGWR